MATIGALLNEGRAAIAGVTDTAELDASVLLGHVLGWGRARLYAERGQAAGEEAAARYRELIARRAAGEPVAYLIGEREFYGLALTVDARVLIPRPDTEILVELALAWISAQGRPLRGADIGTGSGAIAIAIAANAPRCVLEAFDIAPGPLAVAAANVARHGLEARVRVIASDGLEAAAGPYDFIVSNPPYTLIDEIEPMVQRYEPRLALDGGPDGLEIYRRWLPAMAERLRPGGPGGVWLEIGAWQGREVAALAQSVWPGGRVAVHQDLGGRDRVVEVLVAE